MARSDSLSTPIFWAQPELWSSSNKVARINKKIGYLFLFIYWFITICGMQKRDEMQKSPRPHFEITNGTKMK